MSARPHAALVHAWADGAEIQQKDLDGVWRVKDRPHWIASHEYRVKPPSVRLRIAQFRNHCDDELPFSYHVVRDHFQPERNTMFVKFIGEPFEVDE